MELEESGVKLVKINDKKTAKSHGVVTAPGLTFFKVYELLELDNKALGVFLFLFQPGL